MPPRRRRTDHADPDEEERPRQRRQRDASEEVGDDTVTDGDQSGDDMDVDASTQAQNADDLLAKKLVRYALSCEYSRTPIRRDGIKERVLGNQGRSWKKVFALAQKQLRLIWGMELRELPVKEKMSLQERRKAMASSTQVKTGSGAYILTSTLPARYRTSSILAPSKIPTSADEATYVGVCTFIVSTIWLSGGELSEQKLRRQLSRLNAETNISTEKTETVLKRMERQGYVVKRTERPPVGQDGEEIITWHVGSRAREEIGLDGVFGMAEEVYGEKTAELEKKLKVSLGIRSKPVTDDEEAESERVGAERAETEQA
ncbi:hypothetical protein N3K66_000092 [Trichothecium roseum]|uniref:Uncharacterized protein n=1 Tax=Trichothecium roseum TaxID=47278 RepID=A0ACC0VDM0_9HYPO|nr:hypothetical protein N3K66_000092 [Trichothecium roseum]